jgi:hypothetical protein
MNALGFAQLESSGGRRCSTSPESFRTFPGGYVLNFSCSGYTISGVGSTATDGGTNALLFGQVEATGGRRCSASPQSIFSFQGGYLVNFSCSGYTISGVGSTATDAGINGGDFASLEAVGGRRCSTTLTSIRAVPGGYEVRFTCSGRGVTGFGSTATAAGQDALVQAEAL